MSVTRRSFLKILGGVAAVAVVAPKLALAETTIAAPPRAPLYVPPQNLGYGVPTTRLITGRRATAADLHALWQEQRARLNGDVRAPIGERVPMLLLQAEFLLEHGGRLPAGAEVMVDRATADRWIRNAIATPGPSAPWELQVASGRMLAARKERIASSQRAWDAPLADALEVGEAGSWHRGVGLAYDYRGYAPKQEGDEDEAPAGAILTDRYGTWLRPSPDTPDSAMNRVVRRFALEDA